MAISSNPSGTEIWAEFASNSKPSKPAGTTYSLDDAHEQVFGAGIHNRLDFANKAKASGDTVSPQGIDENQANFRANIETGGVSTSYYFEYGIGNYNNTTQTWTISTSDLVSHTITGLTSDSGYQYRVVLWNGFNVNDKVVGSQETFTTSTSNTIPYDLSISQVNFTEPVTVEASWTNATSVSLIIEWRKNGVFQASENLSGNTTSRQRGGFVNGDTASFRVRYTSGDTTWTAWKGTSIFASS